MMKCEERKIKWVSDEVGEDYKLWIPGEKVFIEADTGTGKSHFIISRLQKWAKQLPEETVLVEAFPVYETQMGLASNNPYPTSSATAVSKQSVPAQVKAAPANSELKESEESKEAAKKAMIDKAINESLESMFCLPGLFSGLSSGNKSSKSSRKELVQSEAVSQEQALDLSKVETVRSESVPAVASSPGTSPVVKVPYRVTNRILYLVNRRILRDQINEEIKAIDRENIKDGIFDAVDNIDVRTYQEIEEVLIMGRSYYANLMRGYRYFVFDECHYFIKDATFNTNTELSFNYLMQYAEQAVFIFMSATIEPFKRAFTNYVFQLNNRTINTLRDVLAKKSYEGKYKTYTVERGYEHINLDYISGVDEISKLIETKEDEKKWLIFINSYRLGKSMEKDLNDKGIDTLFLDAWYRSNVEMNNTVDYIVEKKQMDHRVLIATSVLDNGISLKDKRLNNIIIFSDNRVEFIQMLGRRRIDEDERINLFIPKPDINVYRNRLKKLKDIEKRIQICNMFWDDHKKLEEFLLGVYQRGEVDKYTSFLYFRYLYPDEIRYVSDTYFQACGFDERIKNILYNGLSQMIGPKPFINHFSQISISEDISFYETEIKKYENGNDFDLLKTKYSWIGFTPDEIERIVIVNNGDKKSMIITEIEKELESIVDKSMEKEEWIQFKMDHLQGFRKLLRILEDEGSIDKKTRKNLDDHIRKNDDFHTLGEKFPELMKLSGLEFRLESSKNEKKDQIYTIKKVV